METQLTEWNSQPTAVKNLILRLIINFALVCTPHNSMDNSSLHQYKTLTEVTIKAAARQVRYKLNGIFLVKGMDHIQNFGSAMHDAWNMLSSEIKIKM